MHSLLQLQLATLRSHPQGQITPSGSKLRYTHARSSSSSSSEHTLHQVTDALTLAASACYFQITPAIQTKIHSLSQLQLVKFRKHTLSSFGCTHIRSFNLLLSDHTSVETSMHSLSQLKLVVFSTCTLSSLRCNLIRSSSSQSSRRWTLYVGRWTFVQPHPQR